MSTTTLQVRKDQLGHHAPARPPKTQPLADGQVRVRVDAFALTANNITYAAFGEAMGYWQFFPTGEDGWGIVPVWGFGSGRAVAASRRGGGRAAVRLLADGQPAPCFSPDRLTPRGFPDGAPHRAGLHAVYNQYLRCNARPVLHAPNRRRAGAAAAAVHHLLADRRLPGRQRLLRRRRACCCPAPRARPPTAPPSSCRSAAASRWWA